MWTIRYGMVQEQVKMMLIDILVNMVITPTGNNKTRKESIYYDCNFD